jgi:hypothetical protein
MIVEELTPEEEAMIDDMMAEAHKEPDIKPDMVNHPPHYTKGEIECIDAMRAQTTEEEFRGHMKMCAVKYIWRERDKGGDESLRKAIWYLEQALK